MRSKTQGAALTTAAIVTALAMAACGGGSNAHASTTTTSATQTATSTLKIGVPIALTGPIAATAKEMVDGYKLYMKQHDNKLDNVPTHFYYVDDKGSATTTVVAAKQLINQDHVDMFGGASLAPESVAILPIAQKNKIAEITPISSYDNLTQRTTSPYFARVNMTSSQPNLYLGDYAAKHLHYKNMAIVIQDYAYGWQSGGGFQYAFQQDGGHIAKKVYVPLTASTLEPYISQIPQNVTAVYALLIGGFVAPFEQDYKQSALAGKVPLITGPDMIDTNALAAAKTNAIGIVGVHEWCSCLTSAKSFVNAFKKTYGVEPSYWGESTYLEAEWLSKAIAHQESQGTSASQMPTWIKSHGSQFINDVKAVSIVAPQGPMSMTKYGNGVMTIYIWKVTGPEQKKIIYTYKHATQFWTQTPKTFLAHPAFSRTYPPQS